MRFINWIISALVEAADLFWELYIETSGWVYPFSYVSMLFRELLYICLDLADYFLMFGDWAENVADQIASIFNPDEIYSYFKDYFTAAIRAWDWVGAAWTNVTKIVYDWWAITKTTVLGWIDYATEGLIALEVAWGEFKAITFPFWTTALESIGSELSNFFTVTLPTLFDVKYAEEWWRGKATDTLEMINTAFTEREGFWAGWQDWRDKVTEFFTDPFGWVKSHVIEPIVDDFNRGFDRGMKGGGE